MMSLTNDFPNYKSTNIAKSDPKEKSESECLERVIVNSFTDDAVDLLNIVAKKLLETAVLSAHGRCEEIILDCLYDTKSAALTRGRVKSCNLVLDQNSMNSDENETLTDATTTNLSEDSEDSDVKDCDNSEDSSETDSDPEKTESESEYEDLDHKSDVDLENINSSDPLWSRSENKKGNAEQLKLYKDFLLTLNEQDPNTDSATESLKEMDDAVGKIGKEKNSAKGNNSIRIIQGAPRQWPGLQKSKSRYLQRIETKSFLKFLSVRLNEVSERNLSSTLFALHKVVNDIDSMSCNSKALRRGKKLVKDKSKSRKESNTLKKLMTKEFRECMDEHQTGLNMQELTKECLPKT